MAAHRRCHMNSPKGYALETQRQQMTKTEAEAIFAPSEEGDSQ